ncbi:hypothetical protein WK54_10110 [Burkholderia ubonensis]|nr:hypothetical protein WK54_10110 [Burkholderia ubonensis]
MNKAARYWYTSTPLALQVSAMEYRFAPAFAPATVLQNRKLRLPTTNGLIEFSQRLFDIGQVPIST